MEGKAVDFQLHVTSGRVWGGSSEGKSAQLQYKRPVNNHREHRRESIKYDLKYDLNKKHTPSSVHSLPQFKYVFIRAH